MDDEKWLERRYYGGDLPAEAERALHAAGLSWEDEQATEAHIREALAVAPNHIATNFGAFRFFYYRHRLNETLPHLEVWLREATKRNNLPADWRDVTIHHADFSNFDSEPRAFLFALRGYGFVLARLGRMDEGREALLKVAELDPQDHMRAGRMLQTIAEHNDEENDENSVQTGV